MSPLRQSLRPLAVALALAAGAASAEEVVVVTATRSELPASEVGQSVTVIDQDAIDTRQSDTVVDLLRTVPGVSITRNGGVGGTTSVFVRGADADHTVTLIDGVKLNDPAAPSGGFNFANLLTGNVQRIEVLRGSQSVVWGSQAIGGVVNLVTRAPTEEFSANLRAEYGSMSTQEIVGNVSDTFGPVAASVGVTWLETDGISAFNETRGGLEEDGFDNLGAHAQFRIDVSDQVSFDLRGWYSDSQAELDGFPPPNFSLADTREYSETRELVGYAGANFSLLEERFDNRIGFAYTDTERSNFDPDGFVTETFDGNGTNERLEYQGNFEFTDRVRSTFGLERERSEFVSSSFGGDPTRGEARIDSAYVELIAQAFAGFTAIVGARHDDHDEFGGHTTVSGSIAWTPNEGDTTLRASYSEGFKAPSLYELQGDYGNLLLQPETSAGWDAGVTQRLFEDKLELGAVYFQRDTNDLIDFVSCFPPTPGICDNRPFGTYDNVAKSRATGIEATLTYAPVEALSLQANYTHLDAENRSTGSPNYGNDLARRPSEMSSLVVDYTWASGLEAGVTWAKVGRSFDNAANTTVVEGYELVDLRLAYALNDTVHLQARVENLLDESYETVFNYGTSGRAYYAGVRLDFR